MTNRTGPTICIVQPHPCSPSETFLRAHAEHLPGQVIVVDGGVPKINGRPVTSQALVARAFRKAVRVALRRGWDAEVTARFLKFFRHCRPDAVLAEYGPIGVDLRQACLQADIPLIVHFHGYDASMNSVLEELAVPYRHLFRDAAAIVAVSHAMRVRLISLGASEERVHLNHYGVNCAAFGGADPSNAAPVFVSVARFADKKAPHLTLRAFAEVHRSHPDARLRMVGCGPLMDTCIMLAKDLGLGDAVSFLGVQPPLVIQEELRKARCFVQHSVVAPDGDSEGTPVAILEAGASGLPVVSTRHGGIPDVVVEGETGFLVEEGDVSGMADRMLRLAEDPGLAGRFGRQARARIEAEFSMEKRIGQLWIIIESCIHARRQTA
jgi:colanic acid/amylovoran biosynthesis glycosyltransferase